MTGLLEKKIALMTGAGSGIGRASAKAFAREGATVVVSDIMVEGGKETVEMIKEAGGEAIFIKADVSNVADVEALVTKSVETYGRLDCALNNAGIAGDVAAITDCTAENWLHVINVNLNGVWFCMKYEIPHMLKNGGGAIVNTSSISGLHGVRNQAAYSASKHGVIGLTKSAALEYANKKIRINALCPGWTRTAMVESEKVHDQDPFFLAKYVCDRPGTPEELAEAVVWLCSDRASFVNGNVMVIDGGRMAL